MPGTTSDWLLNYLSQGGSLPHQQAAELQNPQNTQIIVGDDSVPALAPTPAEPSQGHHINPSWGPKRMWLDGERLVEQGVWETNPYPDPRDWEPPYDHYHDSEGNWQGGTDQHRGPLIEALFGGRGGGQNPPYGESGPDGGYSVTASGQYRADPDQKSNLPGSPYHANPFSPFLYDAQTGGLQVTDKDRDPNPFTFAPDTTSYRQLRAERGYSPMSENFSPSVNGSFETSPWMFANPGQMQSNGPTYRGPGGLGPTRAPKFWGGLTGQGGPKGGFKFQGVQGSQGGARRHGKMTWGLDSWSGQGGGGGMPYQGLMTALGRNKDRF